MNREVTHLQVLAELERMALDQVVPEHILNLRRIL